MSQNCERKKYCNCPISSDKTILEPYMDHSFCEKCGSVLIKDMENNETIYYTIKPRQMQKPTELSPIQIIRSMKKKVEADFPFFNNEYNLSDKELENKDETMKSIDLYLKNRKMIIMTIQKMMKMLDVSDLSFYQCLFYVDYFLSHIITEETTEKEILYYIVGYFICSSKLKETYIYEPSFESFVSIKKKVYLSVEKISLYEIKCLQSIKYNPFAYSAYDWICELISIGYVFNCEIEKSKSIILINGHRHSLVNVINKYTIKALLDITVKSIFLKYSPMYIAFSLIQLTREKYLDDNLINNELYFKLINLYDIDFSDYEKCYNEIKIEIEEKKEENNIENNTANNENEEECKEKNVQDFCTTDFGSNAENNNKANERTNNNKIWKSSGNIVRLKNKVVTSKQMNNEYEHTNNTNHKIISFNNDIKTINENDSININDKDNNISSINNNKNENFNNSSKNNFASIKDNSIKEIINDINNKNEDENENENNNNKEGNDIKENKLLEKIEEKGIISKSKNDSINFIKKNDEKIEKVNNNSISIIKNDDYKINNSNDSIDFIINDDKDKDIDSNKETNKNKNDSFTNKEKVINNNDIDNNINDNDIDKIQIQKNEKENGNENEKNNIVLNENENENKNKNEDNKKNISEENINTNDNKVKTESNININDINSKDNNAKDKNDNVNNIIISNNANKEIGNKVPNDDENLKSVVKDKGLIDNENNKENKKDEMMKIGKCDNENIKKINDIKDNNIEDNLTYNNKEINSKNELKENKNENVIDIDRGNKNVTIGTDKNNEIKKIVEDKVNNKNNKNNKNNNINDDIDSNKRNNKNEKINMIDENKSNIKRDDEENKKNEKDKNKNMVKINIKRDDEENKNNEKDKNKNNNIIISNFKINNSLKKNKRNNRYENNINMKNANNKLNIYNSTYIENKSIENKKEQNIKINNNSKNKKNENKKAESKKNEKNENNKNENDDKIYKVNNKNYNKNNELSIKMLLSEKKKKNILKKKYNIESKNNDRKNSLKENKLINSQDVNFSKNNKIKHFFIACDINKNSSNDNIVVSRFRKGNNNRIETSTENNSISPNKYQNLFLRANYVNSNLKPSKIRKIKNQAEVTVKIYKRNKEFNFNDDIIKNWGNKEELELMKQYLSYESKSYSKRKDILSLKNKPRNNVPTISNFDDLIKKYDNNNTNKKEELKTYSSFSKRYIFKKRSKQEPLFERDHQKILNENKRNKSTNQINRKINKNNKDFIYAKNNNYKPKRKSLINFAKLN